MRTPARVALHTVVATLLAVAALAGITAQPAAAACGNPVACENELAGTPASDWKVDGDGDPSLVGFGTKMSVRPGDTIGFKIKSTTANFHVDILRLGYYGGDGARKLSANLAPTGPTTQPACNVTAGTGLIDCGNWSQSLSWQVPSTAVSGVYIAHLVRNDTGADNQIIFDVRDDASHSDMVVQTSDSTWQAYNDYGGNSLYVCAVSCPAGNPDAYKGASAVSYNRPLNSASSPNTLLGGSEYSMIRFLEKNGYDATYVSSGDVASRGANLLNHKIFMSSGHDEYWSASQRTSMEAARNAGVNLAFFSGNEGFWKTRWSADSAGGENRTLTSYKDSHYNARVDPVEWTGAWRDSRFTTDADHLAPESALTGQTFVVNSGTSDITVPYPYGKLRLWRNTAAASLATGQSVKLGIGTLGYEWDVDADNGFRPAGSFRVSSTTVAGLEVFTDYASTTQFGQTATHNMTLYRAPSGALVFGAGTVQWAWGLSDWNPNDAAPDKNMRQATENLFADMSVQPTTRETDLVAATQSTDTTKPTSTITGLPASVADGTKVTITGTASDTGGVVGGVEVSTDGGTTWHPATGTTAWSYTWVAHGSPSTTIRTRATDDSGNIETPGAGTAVTVTCPCTLFGTSQPAADDAGDGGSIEVGMKFTADRFGTVSGVRFYKSAANTGTHVGSLWASDGSLLARATFSSESASGWQSVSFSQPVVVNAGQTYVVSYFAPNGHYSATPQSFYRSPSPGPAGGAVIDSAPLHALRNTGGVENGVFNYSPSSTFPTTSFQATNYWVDPVFSPQGPAGNVGAVTATQHSPSSIDVSWSAPSSGGVPTTYVVTPYIGSVAQTATTVNAPATTTTVTGVTAGTTYRFTVRAVNPAGSGAESAPSNAVTPTPAAPPSAPSGVQATPASHSAGLTWTASASDGGATITQQTVTPYIGSNAQTPQTVGATATSATISGLSNGVAYTFKVTATNASGTSAPSAASNAVTPWSTIFDLTTPSTADCGDTSSVELGVRFTADSDGAVTGIRFYKATANTGTHSGSLWTANGTRLAQATFTNEGASGWQSVAFADPVPVTAGTTYVASYFAPSGHYACTAGGLNSAVDNPPLHALATTTASNGLYHYGATSSFPTKSFNGGNYWVDVMYGQLAPGRVTNVAAGAAGPTSASVTWSAPATGGTPSSYKITPYAGATPQATKTVAAPATGATVTGLTTGTAYTFTVTASNDSGAGAESAPSNAVTPITTTVPAAPTGVAARPASSSALVTWTVPSSDGGKPITGQTVTPYIGTAAQAPKAVSATATSATVTGLTNGDDYTFVVTATNDNGDSVGSAQSNSITPWATIFDFTAPGTVDGFDPSAVEVGVKFTSDVDGDVTGIRFYKATANTGTHIGSLWSAGGSRLAQVTFTNETGSGWQHATFSTPVTISAGTTYVASYFAPNGHYSLTSNGLSSAVNSPPLHAVGNATSPNGVYGYGSASLFPTGSFLATDYGVDLLFKPTGRPGAPTAVQATAGNASATVAWTAPSSGGAPTSYKVTPYVGSTAQTPKTITGSPLATSTKLTGLTPGASYTFTVQAIDPAGGGPQSSNSNAVVPNGASLPDAPTGVTAQADSASAVVGWTAPDDNGGSPITGYTITPYLGATALSPTQAGAAASTARIGNLTNGSGYRFTVKAVNAKGAGNESTPSASVTPGYSIFDMGTPANDDVSDNGPVVLGLRFFADTNGSVTGARFYKGADNTGTHVAGVWNASGQLLTTGTFQNETATGWQTVTFAQPAPITQNAAYVVGYLAPKGHYAVTSGAFAANSIDQPPLHAFENSNGSNGVYLYSSGLALPTDSFGATNYWVDVLFAKGN
jgi:Domain of unknown function (DUF4082)/Fibronectin type III domain